VLEMEEVSVALIEDLFYEGYETRPSPSRAKGQERASRQRGGGREALTQED